MGKKRLEKAHGSRRKAHGIKTRHTAHGARLTVKANGIKARRTGETLEGGKIGWDIFRNLGFGSEPKGWLC